MAETQGRIAFDGVIVRVLVCVSAAEERHLRAGGHSIPRPFATTALIDTGASRSIIHPLMVPYLGLVSTGATTALATAGGGLASVALYDGRFTLDHAPGPWPMIEVQVAAIAPATTSVLAIIGRDLLAKGLLLYDGPGQAFSVVF